MWLLLQGRTFGGHGECCLRFLLYLLLEEYCQAPGGGSNIVSHQLLRDLKWGALVAHLVRILLDTGVLEME